MSIQEIFVPLFPTGTATFEVDIPWNESGDDTTLIEEAKYLKLLELKWGSADAAERDFYEAILSSYKPPSEPSFENFSVCVERAETIILELFPASQHSLPLTELKERAMVSNIDFDIIWLSLWVLAGKNKIKMSDSHILYHV